MNYYYSLNLMFVSKICCQGKIMKNIKYYKTLKYLLLILLILITTIQSKAEEKYYLHSKVFQNINNDKSLEPIIEHWIAFLYEPNDSLRKYYWDIDDIDLFHEDYCLFCKHLFQFPRETFFNEFKIIPYIISIEKREDIYFIKSMFVQKNINLSNSFTENQNPVGIIKVGMIRKNNKLFLKNIIINETRNWPQFTTNHIKYIVEPNIEIDSVSCLNAARFCDSLSLKWYGTEYKDTIQYFVTPSSESAELLLGLDFAFFGSFTGVTLNSAGIIIDGTKNFNFRHELVHIVLGEFPNRLLNEGLATYFGGSGQYDFITILSEFSKKNYPLTKEKIKQFYSYPGFRDYYVFGALICEQIYGLKGINGLKLISDSGEGDDILIQNVCKLLNITEDELIEKINTRIKD